MPKQTFRNAPYYDDYYSEKNYLRILFKPKKSIQVRELNQIQSIFNNQIESFADHIFKFGSRVDAGSVRYFDSVDYVKLVDETVDESTIIGKKYKGTSSGLTVVVTSFAQKEVINKTTGESEPNTLYVNYIGLNDSGEIKFRENETLQNINDSTDTLQVSGTGKGTLFKCSESTYYVYGCFVSCPAQTIVLSKYDKEPTYKIGLAINQIIVDSSKDLSLLDNAIDTNNYLAEGADRYKITLKLVKKNIDSENDQNFIFLGKVINGNLTETINLPQYSEISKMIARRTYDESGDYTVRPFIMSLSENEDDSTKYNVTLSSGKAYVRGYEIDKTNNSYLTLDKNDASMYSEYKIDVSYNNSIVVTDTPPDLGVAWPAITVGDQILDVSSERFTYIDATGTQPLNGTFTYKAYQDVDANNWVINFFDFDGTLDQNFDYPTANDYLTVSNSSSENKLIFVMSEDIKEVVSATFVSDGVTTPAVFKTKTPTISTSGLAVGVPTDDLTLPKADCYELISVINVTQGNIDITDGYEIVHNATSNYYQNSKVRLSNQSFAPESGDQLNITYKYYDWGNTSGHCFVKDSYLNLSDSDVTDFDGTLRTFDLLNCFDFRPLKLSNNTFQFMNGIPDNDTTIDYAITNYVSRIDTISLDSSGNFIVTKGVPDRFPKEPVIPDNSMPIYNIRYDRYTNEIYQDIYPKFIENTRYTMRDIGVIEKQIQDLEYYTSLNLLERELDDMEVYDSNGNKRYKNGFITDDFSGIDSSYVSSKDYQASIDMTRQELRPSFKKRDVKLDFIPDMSENFKQMNDVVTLPYEEIVWIDQPFSSKTLSINPYFIYSAEGKMELTPANDSRTDTVNDPPVKANLVTAGSSSLNMLKSVASDAGLTGTFWDAPTITREVVGSTTSQSSISKSRVGLSVRVGGSVSMQGAFRVTTSRLRETTNTTTVVTTRQTDRIREQRDYNGDLVNVENEITNYNVGNVVNNVELLTYTRSTDIQFFCSGLKGNTKMYFFFDGVDVTEDVRPIGGVFGDDIISSEGGNISGVFRIPNKEGKRFFIGTKLFRVTNSKTNSEDPDELLCFAEAQYHSGGLKQNKNERVLSVTAPAITHTPVTKTEVGFFNQTRVVGQTVSETQSVRGRTVTRRKRIDPIAQSFLIEDHENGLFLTKIDTFFSHVGITDDPVWLEVREMVNGYPGPALIPFGRVTKTRNEISISEDGSVPTTWNFESPIYLVSGQEYCFIIGGDDPDFRVHVSKLGGKDILSGELIQNQPSMGSLFKGQNNSTWNAEQTEDIKFTLYKAKFNISSEMKVAFSRNEINDREPMKINPLQTVVGSNQVIIHHLNHGFNVGDKVVINMLEDNEFDLLVNSGDISEGQIITGSNGSFVIKDCTYIGTDEETGKEKYSIKPSNLFGYFSDGEVVSGEPYNEVVSNKANVAGVTIEEQNTVALSAVIPDGIDNTFNGIPLKELSRKSHTVTNVESLDTFTIELDESKATQTGFIGGLGNYLTPNIVFESMNFIVSDIDIFGSKSWYYDSVRHAGIGSTIQNDLAITGQNFDLNVMNEFNLPIKMNTLLNDSIKYESGDRSFVAYGNYNSEDENVSPIINITNITAKTFGNRIEWNDSVTNSNWVDETDALGLGTEKAKYVTLPVNMDNPANDIRVLFDLSCPEFATVELYFRVLDDQSYESILYENWSDKIEFKIKNTENAFEFIEHEINIPYNEFDVKLELPNFKSYQIKLVMKTKNSARVPLIKRLRCIATT